MAESQYPCGTLCGSKQQCNRGVYRCQSAEAPVSSLACEIGNAFSAMFRRGQLSLAQARAALTAYRAIPVRLIDVDLSAALGLAHELGFNAYDAYFIACAQRQRCPLLSLDRGLLAAAATASVQTIEVVT